MFKWLQKLFKPKLTTIPEMVRFLKKKELNIYQNRLALDHQDFIESSIDNYIAILNKIVSSDYLNTYISIKNISPYNIKHMSYAEWVSSKKYIRDNTNTLLLQWVELAEKVYYLYSIGINDNTNSFANGNSRKIQPYIINIENILKDICTRVTL